MVELSFAEWFTDFPNKKPLRRRTNAEPQLQPGRICLALSPLRVEFLNQPARDRVRPAPACANRRGAAASRRSERAWGSGTARDRAPRRRLPPALMEAFGIRVKSEPTSA